MTSPLRLELFIDAQNTYRSARRSFFSPNALPVNGQFNPRRLGEIVAERSRPGGAACILHDVRIYTGRPDPEKDSRTYAAHMRQCDAWEAAGARVISRPLRYPRGWPAERAQEKGVDIALAIDFVTMAIEREYDVGVIMSTDTDLRPALEFTSRRSEVRQAAVAAWRGASRRQRLAIPGANLWCHWLDRDDYDAVADPTSYAR
ncbi:MAG: NYN domain-containing protein [Chloroflexota bacterium]|nr:NYN domain-containing protein [Chloroflexota bacterium]MDE2885633.1 NYN domain-containing protein [Chloroflexota bacterium]